MSLLLIQAIGPLNSNDTFDVMVGINRFEFAAIDALLELGTKKHVIEGVS